MFACIYIPDLPVEAIVRAEPDLRERAIVILDGAPPLTRVVSLNEPARQAGVEAGMTSLQVEAASGIVLRRRSPAQEAAAHAALLDCACAFSPRVEDTAADTILLDLAGLERLFGPAPAIARDLARRVAEVGLEPHVAVASNPDAAIHAARGFPGVTVIPAGHEAERLGTLPIDLLAPTPEVLETMDRWGMRSFHAFAVLPEVAVAERLGQAGIELQKLARGAARRELVPIEPPLVFEEAVELEHPIDLLEPLAFLLNRMLEQLCSRLQSRALATNELHLRLALDVSSAAVTEDGATSTPDRHFERTLKLPVPMHDAKVLLKLVQLDLKAHPPGAPVLRVWLAAEPVKPRSTQSAMFVPSAPEPERLEITLARLAGIVGEGRVGSPQVLDTHRPDAFRMQHFTGCSTSRDPRGWPTLSPGFGEGWAEKKSTTSLALRLFRPALRASVELSDGRPVRIAYEGARLQVLSASGPWRTSGEWWTDDAVIAPGKLGTIEKDYGWNRDEWDIAVLARPPAADDTPGLAAVTERITLLRIYFDRKMDLWFVEGSYD